MEGNATYTLNLGKKTTLSNAFSTRYIHSVDMASAEGSDVSSRSSVNNLTMGNIVKVNTSFPTDGQQDVMPRCCGTMLQVPDKDSVR